MAKNDQRVRFTKMALRESLLFFMKKKPTTKITVKELCENAEINRATFYAHYKDIAGLLKEIEDEIFEKVLLSLEFHTAKTDDIAVNTEIITTLQKNKELCDVVFGEFGDGEFLEKITNIAHDKSIEYWKAANESIPEEFFEALYTYVAHGSAAMVRLWVKNGMNESPDKISQLIDLFTKKGISAFITIR